jgi:alpha-tubulin suppressor-like RCC1 family protein
MQKRIIGGILPLLLVGACADEGPEDELGTAEQAAQRARQLETIERVVTGHEHSCVLVADGTVKCWGANYAGQLGDGTTTDSLTPRPVAGLTGAVALSAGFAHTCAVKSNGRVYCWGTNAAGVLGRDPAVTSFSATALEVTAGTTGAVSVTTGHWFTCSLHDNGEVQCWGENLYGQLGAGETVGDRFTPVTIPGLSSVSNIAAGGWHVCASRLGAVRCWGRNDNGQLGVDTVTYPTRNTPIQIGGMSGVEQVSAGHRHTCVLREDGNVDCFGSNAAGQLGDGSAAPFSVAPVAITGLSDAKALVLGEAASCGVDGSGIVRCWGSNANHVLGRGAAPDPLLFGQAGSVLTLGAVSAVGLKYDHGCAITPTGTVKCWGKNDHGQLGDGTLVDRSLPVTVAGLNVGTGATDVDSDYQRSCGRRANGTVKCWGKGFGSTPVTIAGLSNVEIVRVGAEHACALQTGGTVRCWGENGDGQVGDGTTTDRTSPVAVTLAERAVDLTLGADHTCVVGASGKVYCWGEGGLGALGHGLLTSSSVPVESTGLVDAVTVSAGDDHTCALRVTGVVSCWGANDQGQLGTGSAAVVSTVPVATSVKTGTAIALGHRHSCAITTNGAGFCWGWNSNGQIGDGTTTNRNKPAQVSGLFKAVDIGAGSSTCAHLSDGTVTCWGTYPLDPEAHTPTPIAGVSNVARLSVGAWHACAARANGTIVCWGMNDNGEMGNGTIGAYSPPVTALGFP